MPLAVVVDDALVDALVAAAGEHEVLLGCELARDLLRERLAGGRRHDEQGVGCPVADDAVERLAPWLGLHDHAGAPAVGRVVDGAVAVVRVVAEVVRARPR